MDLAVPSQTRSGDWLEFPPWDLIDLLIDSCPGFAYDFNLDVCAAAAIALSEWVQMPLPPPLQRVLQSPNTN